ncbi:MAG: cytochrome c biogenesis protein CcsA [Bacteroidetes bacterium]|nr:cytochrome c biogenesis protein CcsA [Bacteroidota bacterium]MCL1969662.1 cytochrome c biogenesis protein CcsA [Bacteroidota bacterium]
MTRILQIDTAFFYLTTALLLLLIASFLAIKSKEKKAIICQTFGVLILCVFIIGLWVAVRRPPFSTMGETRIWYAFFLSLMGLITYWRWKMNYLLVFTNLMAVVFLLINICTPEIQSQVLMPALQSVWFIPHVATYMFAYAVIGCAFVVAVLELLKFSNHKGHKEPPPTLSKRWESTKDTKCNLLVQIGTTALGIGLCLGALWAKKAWGQYWSWDIKETAALITWAIFLLYIHLQKNTKINRKILFIILMIGFLSLNFTWYGVKFLPASQKSPHTFYNTTEK